MLCKCLEMELSYKTRVWMETMYSLGKENVQNREFGLNKLLIKPLSTWNYETTLATLVSFYIYLSNSRVLFITVSLRSLKLQEL